MTRKKAEPEDLCYVAKMSCGHYVGAVSGDEEDRKLARETIEEWRNAGLAIETKTVDFVRNGGLTFCDCKTWERAMRK